MSEPRHLIIGGYELRIGYMPGRGWVVEIEGHGKYSLTDTIKIDDLIRCLNKVLKDKEMQVKAKKQIDWFPSNPEAVLPGILRVFEYARSECILFEIPTSEDLRARYPR
jgi:hypothetical protein